MRILVLYMELFNWLVLCRPSDIEKEQQRIVIVPGEGSDAHPMLSTCPILWHRLCAEYSKWIDWKRVSPIFHLEAPASRKLVDLRMEGTRDEENSKDLSMRSHLLRWGFFLVRLPSSSLYSRQTEIIQTVQLGISRYVPAL